MPAALAGEVSVGSIVAVRLQGRRVRAFVLEIGSTPPAGVELLELDTLGRQVVEGPVQPRELGEDGDRGAVDH